MYADTITASMEETIRETDRRRAKQIEYNKLHHITPRQVAVKLNPLAAELYQEKAANPRLANSPSGRVSAADSVSSPTYIPSPSELGRGTVSVGFGHDSLREDRAAYSDGFVKADLAAVLQDPVIRSMSRSQIEKMIAEDKRRMEKSASTLDFSAAAKYRDEMWALQEYLKVWSEK
jgi:excinuclease ABC subunit B